MHDRQDNDLIVGRTEVQGVRKVREEGSTQTDPLFLIPGSRIE
jgi:hypothetical protein